MKPNQEVNVVPRCGTGTDGTDATTDEREFLQVLVDLVANHIFGDSTVLSTPTIDRLIADARREFTAGEKARD